MYLHKYSSLVVWLKFKEESLWVYLQVDKAGATVLFEEPMKGSNSIGVVVNPVRLSSLGDFGSPQFVADKLIQAEKRKVSACYIPLHVWSLFLY